MSEREMSPLDRLPRREMLRQYRRPPEREQCGMRAIGRDEQGRDRRDGVERGDRPGSVSVTISRADDEDSRLETTLSLDPGERPAPTARDKLPVGADYTVEVDVEGGPTETYSWADVSLDPAPLHVILACNAEIYSELQSSELHL